MNNDTYTYNKNGSTLCNTCLYNPHYLIIHKKMVSQLVAFFLLLSFFIFAAGYFLGKKKLAEDFSHIAEQANFSDQINFALTSLYDQEPLTIQANKDNTVSELEQKESLVLDQKPVESGIKNTVSNKRYIAQLFGGNHKSVTQFAQRLAQRGISVEIRNRTSKTAKGKTIQWYQAVTQPYDNESDLKALVATIQKLEKINNISIIERPLSA